MILTKYCCYILVSAVMFHVALPECRADEIYTKNKKANKLFDEGKYEDALKLYDDALLLSPGDNALKMNKGSALYRLNDYQKAQEAYKEALTDENKQKRADAYYNLGNILFRQGEQMYKAGDPKSNELFKNAFEHYIQSLDLNPNDKNAKWNLQLAHEMVKQTEQMQQQQQQNDQNKDKNDNLNKDKQDNSQDKENQEQQENNENKEQKEENKEQEKQNQDQQQQQENQQQQQEQHQQQPEQDPNELEKEEAMRLIELYSDDADSLNKPTQKKNASRKNPEQDW